MPTPKKCVRCNKDFQASADWNVYCSTTCSQTTRTKKYRAKKRLAKAKPLAWQ